MAQDRSNASFTHLLYAVARALDVEKVPWKPESYRRAAQSIDNLTESLSDLYRQSGEPGLRKIPGVGPRIAMHIVEFLKTGIVKSWEPLLAKYPPALTELFDISGLGPRRIAVLKAAGIATKAALAQALKEKRIQSLPGFSSRLEAQLEHSLAESGAVRMLASRARVIALQIVERLRPLTSEIHLAGSLRRCKETVGDIDLLAASDNPDAAMHAFISMPNVSRILATGPHKSMVALKEGIQVDIRIVPAQSMGAALLYFTGNRTHTVSLRNRALDQGFTLSEYGLYPKNSKKLVASKTEAEIYNKLGYDYIEPELREMRGELAAAEHGTLPLLVKKEDLKGDFHLHTNRSDGRDSLESMVKAAVERGYEYIAITDHSPSLRIANGLSVERLKESWKAIDSLEKKYPIRILKGAEIDILPDGSLDYPEAILEQLEVAVCAVHTKFQLSEEAMTERIVTALGNPYLDILAHPTGRLIGKRPGYTFDIDAVFGAAKKNKKILEIDGQPLRLDLTDSHILAAKREFGLQFSIDSDAHASYELGFIDLALSQARRGWLAKNDVVNTRSLKDLKKMFKRIQ